MQEKCQLARNSELKRKSTEREKCSPLSDATGAVAAEKSNSEPTRGKQLGSALQQAQKIASRDTNLDATSEEWEKRAQPQPMTEGVPQLAACDEALAGASASTSAAAGTGTGGRAATIFASDQPFHFQLTSQIALNKLVESAFHDEPEFQFEKQAATVAGDKDGNGGGGAGGGGAGAGGGDGDEKIRLSPEVNNVLRSYMYTHTRIGTRNSYQV